MKREGKLEREYRKMVTQAAPDLWDRIEGRLADRTAETEGERKPGTIDEEEQGRDSESVSAEDGRILRLPRFRLYGAAAAVAVFLMILVVVPGLWDMNMGRSGNTTRSTAGAYDAGQSYGEAEIEEEEAGAGNIDGCMETAAETVAAMAETAAETMAMTAEITAETEIKAGRDGFSEDSLGDTQLLCLVTVQRTDRAGAEEGDTDRVICKVLVDEVCYREEDPNEGQAGGAADVSVTEEIAAGSMLTVEIPDTEADDSAQTTPEICPEERYLLPLVRRDGVWEPVLPQIRVTEDGGYLFPAVYESLLDGSRIWNIEQQEMAAQNTGQKRNEPQDGAEDASRQIYYRDDTTLVPELIMLIRNKKAERQNP